MTFDEQMRRVLDAALAELNDAARGDMQRAREEGVEEGRAKGRAEGRSQGFEEGRTQGLDEGRAQAEQHAQQASMANSAAFEQLVDAFRAIDRARSLSEALDTAASCAFRDAARAAVLLVRDGHIRAWRFIGFDGPLNETSFEQPLSASPVVEQAVDSRSAASAGDVPEFAKAGSGPGRSFAFPLEVAGEVVAVLYADGIEGDAKGAAELSLEAIGRHTSRAIEALTALKTARALAHGAGDSDGANVESADGEDEAEESARRYAKLLVSEIKLYHEPAVLAGRRDRDLISRLGGEIARARSLYEARVPQAVRMRGDYFRDELVKTLANGDSSLLHLT